MKLALVFIPASAFLVVSAPWVVRALFGAKFGAAVPIFRISVLGVMIDFYPNPRGGFHVQGGLGIAASGTTP